MDNQTKTPSTGSNKTLMAILAYIGPFVIISYLVSKDDPFVKFHIKQGLVLLSISVLMWILGMIMWTLFPLIQIVNLFVVILAIWGIVNAAQGKETILPLVGQFGSRFNI